MLESLFLLLPLAAYSGWWIGKRSHRAPVSGSSELLSADYYRGLNYLLNEQPNKAVDAFIRMLDVSPDSFDTTMALGNFFRRRGEVDRAIRIHQGLTDKPDLDEVQRSQSRLALAEDYMRAGVYDRAESLLLEVNKSIPLQDTSLKNLKNIYEREKDWEKAIEITMRLQKTSRQSLGKEIAQYYCELAEIDWSNGRIRLAFKRLKQGLQFDSNCARISMLHGQFKQKLGKYHEALRAYKRIEHQDSRLLPEVLTMIIECYERIEEKEALAAYLDYLMHHYPIRIALANAQKVKAQFDFHLAQTQGESTKDLLMLKGLIEKLLENKPIYRCNSCGFSARSLQWQCPSCRQWATVTSILGTEG